MSARRQPNAAVNDVVDGNDDVTEANRRISRPDTEAADNAAERLVERAASGARAGTTPAAPELPEDDIEDVSPGAAADMRQADSRSH